MTSQEMAIKILKEARVVTTPGTAFGDSGEGFLRMSFASSPEELRVAVQRLNYFFDGLVTI